jgi:hypothetical protein
MFLDSRREDKGSGLNGSKHYPNSVRKIFQFTDFIKICIAVFINVGRVPLVGLAVTWVGREVSKVRTFIYEYILGRKWIFRTW